MSACSHNRLVQISTLTATTDWTRDDDGFHEPDDAITKVLGEDTEWFECSDCGERVCPDLRPSAEGRKMLTQAKLTLAQIARQVATEWARDGKLTVPPDADTTDDDAFWDEVQRRYGAQDGRELA